jgi:fumarylpyruvate hydrolase
MTSFVFPPAPQAAVAVRGTHQLFPVNRIFCVGRNYAAHAREMGADPTREPPFYFNKAPADLVASGSTVPYALGTRNLHYEMELVVALGRPALRVTPEEAAACVWGYACGLDMTRRDLQNAAKEIGRPWDFGKDFDNAAVISPLVPASELGLLTQGVIQLSVNGVVKQSGDLSDMIWAIPEVIANLSAYYQLQPGDLIYTGTPEGVGPVKPGDTITGHIDRVGEIALTIGPSL